MKLGLLVNPAAGRGRAEALAPRVIHALRDMGFEPQVAFTRARGDGTRATRSLLDAGAEVIACLGGDGSFNEAAQALAGTGVPGVYLPGGRGNDLAKSLLGRALPWKQALSILGNPKPRRVDMGLLKRGNFSRGFVNGFGMGFDGHVAKKIDEIKGLSGFWLYLAAVLGGFREFSPPRGEMEAGDLIFSGRFLLSGAGLGQFLGGGFRLFPKASMDDGLLDAYAIEPVSSLRFLLTLHRVKKGTHLDMPEVHYAQAPGVRFFLRDRTVAHLDGEVVLLEPGPGEVICQRNALLLWT